MLTNETELRIQKGGQIAEGKVEVIKMLYVYVPSLQNDYHA